MGLNDVLTIVAIILGPSLAVWVTRWLDDRRFKRQRKMDIFRTLMSTRSTPLDVYHVSALNLIEIDFNDNQKVVDAWKNYLKSLESWPQEDMQKQEKIKECEKLRGKLIQLIAKDLKIDIEPFGVLDDNYVPQGWIDDYNVKKWIDHELLNILQGNRPIRVTLDKESDKDQGKNKNLPEF